MIDLLMNVRIKPVVLQVKVDVYHVGKHIDPHGDHVVAFAKQNNITVVGYSPFSGHPFVLKPMEDPIVKYIASQRGNTPAQVLLRWQFQHGNGVLTRTIKQYKLKENLQALSIEPLTSREMHLLDTLQYLVETPANAPVVYHFDRDAEL
jgi:alcohol dehydrogenase (NADP+)